MKKVWWKIIFAFLVILRIAGPIVALIVFIIWTIYTTILHHKNKPK